MFIFGRKLNSGWICAEDKEEMFKASANESARASIGHFSLLIHFVFLVKYGPLSIDTSQIGPNCRFSKDICDRSYMKYMLTTQLTSFLTMWINPGERSDPINKLPKHLWWFKICHFQKRILPEAMQKRVLETSENKLFPPTWLMSDRSARCFWNFFSIWHLRGEDFSLTCESQVVTEQRNIWMKLLLINWRLLFLNWIFEEI